MEQMARQQIGCNDHEKDSECASSRVCGREGINDIHRVGLLGMGVGGI